MQGWGHTRQEKRGQERRHTSEQEIKKALSQSPSQLICFRDTILQLHQDKQTIFASSLHWPSNQSNGQLVIPVMGAREKWKISKYNPKHAGTHPMESEGCKQQKHISFLNFLLNYEMSSPSYTCVHMLHSSVCKSHLISGQSQKTTYTESEKVNNPQLRSAAVYLLQGPG